MPENNIPDAPTKDLLLARRVLEVLPYFQLVEDWRWYASVARWALHCRICIDWDGKGRIPPSTDWYVLAESVYPWGSIDFHPAKEGGIQDTFWHQSHNSIGDAKVPWRDGKICEKTSLRGVGRRAYDVEPFGAADRLLWSVERARDWLIAASLEQLVLSGEPFELPEFKTGSESVQAAFIEDSVSFSTWEESCAVFGTVDFSRLDGNNGVYAASVFKDVKGRSIYCAQYGECMNRKDGVSGLWVKASIVPVMPPWKAPSTYVELLTVLKSCGIDFERILLDFVRHNRDGKRHLLLVGFPIPESFGGTAKRYHWQCAILPVFSHGTQNGFRPNEQAYSDRDRATVLKPESGIDWIKSRNWHQDQITSRGAMSRSFTSEKVLIIGAGALGSTIAELLVRQGCCNLVIVDGDIFEVGNLVRHTLAISNVGTRKSLALAARLRQSNPHARITGECSGFPLSKEDGLKAISECGIVIDCTAEDAVLSSMFLHDWSSERMFFSVSIGMKAVRLFVFGAKGYRFPHSEFIECLRPWIEREREEHKDMVLPREGIGCYHPVFPARADDIWLMASAAVKSIEGHVGQMSTYPVFDVFEQMIEKGRFQGVRKV